MPSQRAGESLADASGCVKSATSKRVSEGLTGPLQWHVIPYKRIGLDLNNRPLRDKE
jgi:hypothetical protein